jgi:hypothetical protein
MHLPARALLVALALGALGLLVLAGTASAKGISGLWQNSSSGVVIRIEHVPGTQRFVGRHETAAQIQRPPCVVQIPIGNLIFKWKKAPKRAQGKRSKGVLYKGRERIYRVHNGGCSPFMARSSARLKKDKLKVRTADPRLSNVLTSTYLRQPLP